MTKSDLNTYRNVLETKQVELLQVVRNRDGIAIEKNPDSMWATQAKGKVASLTPLAAEKTATP